ncbi:hypothetical protein [Mycoplasmopsis cynos]|uniref:hypothetical protein n=1 Tax=Mycoplasmopsis cynos TaxID=171284 RepID=UPI00114124EA|nr:hypothetical protein [Mycoplasmopsis cynos]TQC54610.1 hypothetical protein E1I74_02350 [Mycoplasmopsis cynos]
MKTKIDLTNYNNFYKTESEKEELKKELYKLANEQEWSYFYELDDDSVEFKEFLTVENDSVWLNDDLSIEQLMYFIEKTTNHYYGFWTFSEYNKRYKTMLNGPEFHAFSTREYNEYNAELKLAQNYLAETE